MDFGEEVSLGNSSSISSSVLCSSSNNNIVSYASDSIVGAVETKWFGSGYSKQEWSVINEDGEEEDLLRSFKAAKPSSFCDGEQRSKMLSFSSQNNAVTLPYYNNHLNTSSSPGNNSVINGAKYTKEMMSQSNIMRGPFTPSQWIELQHQAMIFRYIKANVPVPHHFLYPIRKAFEYAGLSCYSSLRSNPLGFPSTDPEPGRCRRTDGKKWRCSREAVAEHKYCERHMNRGRHRSRKPVEGQNSHSTPSANNAQWIQATTSTVSEGGLSSNGLGITRQHRVVSNWKIDGDDEFSRLYLESTQPEFGLVCSSSLVNPANSKPGWIDRM